MQSATKLMPLVDLNIFVCAEPQNAFAVAAMGGGIDVWKQGRGNCHLRISKGFSNRPNEKR